MPVTDCRENSCHSGRDHQPDPGLAYVGGNGGAHFAAVLAGQHRGLQDGM